jgi:hypothetical protein
MLNVTKMFSPPYRSPQNPQELTLVTMRVEQGWYGWNRVDTVLICMDPVQNPGVCDCSINHHPFGSFSPGSNPDCNFEWHAVCGKGRCGFTLRVEVGRCGSNRFNTDINTELKSLQKILNTTQKVFFFAVS